ncbi:hypothetical protein LTR56_017981 [Elasticomyces elasticus]|nr:hypothetical protein LTR56_017981 [Elasticomyces elasticus]KAK3637182.1 hypothetical protein LTR22_018372 [Elasticomyces elasticus]KAK4914255.1 hypothetical protein LTR49_017498 [Elasticomyces elasticus]KAK5749653.1 hypothetical protein LTS12_020291 [Elasticomyces elasticus]
MDNTHWVVEGKLQEDAQHHEGRRTSLPQDAFNRRHSVSSSMTGRRDSLSKNFEKANIAMVVPDHTHLEMTDDEISSGQSIDNISPSWFVWLVALTASIAGALFGYDTGIISAVLVYLGNDLDGRPTSSGEKEAITSLCSAGAFIGAIIAGLTADKFGRKIAIYVGCVLFVVGAVLQAAAYSIAQMCVGRLIALREARSYHTALELLSPMFPTVRFNNSSTSSTSFADAIHAGWRYMIGLGAVPAILLGCLLPFCPESPRQLVYHGKIAEAERVIGKIYAGATEDQIRQKVALIAAACEETKELNDSSRWQKIKMLHTNPAYFRALVCACGLMVISQMSGFNTLMYYSSTLFALVGFKNPVAVGLVVAGTNFIMTWINMMTVDSVGRRRILISTAWGMSAGLLAVAVAFSFIPIDRHTLELTDPKVSSAAIVVLVFIIWFVVFYGVSVGNTAWMSTDFFPMEVRAMGTMWLTCSCWGSNIIVSSTFLSMMKGMTPSGAFGFYAAICGIGWVLIILFYPEVSGLTLEEIGEVFKHGFGVKYARELRKERKDEIAERMRTMEKPIPGGH